MSILLLLAAQLQTFDVAEERQVFRMDLRSGLSASSCILQLPHQPLGHTLTSSEQACLRNEVLELPFNYAWYISDAKPLPGGRRTLTVQASLNGWTLRGSQLKLIFDATRLLQVIGQLQTLSTAPPLLPVKTRQRFANTLGYRLLDGEFSLYSSHEIANLPHGKVIRAFGRRRASVVYAFPSGLPKLRHGNRLPSQGTGPIDYPVDFDADFSVILCLIRRAA